MTILNPFLQVLNFEGFLFLLDMDECQSSSACRSGLVCNNTVGSYRCECSLGYVEGPNSQNVTDPLCVGKEMTVY